MAQNNDYNVNQNSNFGSGYNFNGTLAPQYEYVDGQLQANFPFYSGGYKSTVASIPEYKTNPLLFEKDLMLKLTEGRGPNFMKLLLEQFSVGGGRMVKKPKFEYEVEAEPTQRVYISKVVDSEVSGTKVLRSKFFVRDAGLPTSSNKKIKTPIAGIPRTQVGDIAKLEKEQFVLIMFSWTTGKRDVKSIYKVNNAVNPKYIMPEIGYITDINYEQGWFEVSRNWTANKEINAGASEIGSIVIGEATGNIHPKDAFIIPMSKALREDELEGRVRWSMGTYEFGYIQQDSTAYGSRRMAEVMARNLGAESPLAKTKMEALRTINQRREWTALFGEGGQEFDPTTNLWRGTTDGVLAKIPEDNHILVKGIDYENGNMGTFDLLLFNKWLEDKCWVGNSTYKIIIAGIDFETAFKTMINKVTNAVSEIQSEWSVVGTRYNASNGLTIEVIPSDVMNLNGMRDLFFVVDPQYFKMVGLEGYPTIDDILMPQTHPFHEDGFFHTTFGFINQLPAAHYVGRVVPNSDANVPKLGCKVSEYQG